MSTREVSEIRKDDGVTAHGGDVAHSGEEIPFTIYVDMVGVSISNIVIGDGENIRHEKELLCLIFTITVSSKTSVASNVVPMVLMGRITR